MRVVWRGLRGCREGVGWSRWEGRGTGLGRQRLPPLWRKAAMRGRLLPLTRLQVVAVEGLPELCLSVRGNTGVQACAYFPVAISRHGDPECLCAMRDTDFEAERGRGGVVQRVGGNGEQGIATDRASQGVVTGGASMHPAVRSRGRHNKHPGMHQSWLCCAPSAGKCRPRGRPSPQRSLDFGSWALEAAVEDMRRFRGILEAVSSSLSTP